MILDVILNNDVDDPDLPTLQQFQEWVNLALIMTKKTLSSACNHVDISIIDKSKSAELNAEYRKKQGPTNVLSFHYESIPGFLQESLGDLAICAELVREEAAFQQKSLQAHWAHLTIHGILHLLGYDHAEEEQAIIMESLEMAAMKQLGFENPY